MAGAGLAALGLAVAAATAAVDRRGVAPRATGERVVAMYVPRRSGALHS